MEKDSSGFSEIPPVEEEAGTIYVSSSEGITDLFLGLIEKIAGKEEADSMKKEMDE